ncbi:hypothetical protein CCUS01_10644 [Colletotrichum cuscutae]|uniref:Uncharacterized protein n=1 Tax=Colletotrichum cuscutae TaxID=1209917 RepID=A0AAI9U6T9_9PEZI|nr:hypothetical protein CCUS01_10644 [Colletotrichum cuscutae]
MILNSYGGPAFFTGQDGQDMNGKFNNMRGMAAGITRVDVDEHGNWSVRWTKDTKSKGVSVLSTNNGLVYHYVQDDQRAMTDEEYVWYLMGRSWVTGEEKFKVRAGSGGAFNDNWNSGALGSCGTFYQCVSGGIVAFKDGDAFWIRFCAEYGDGSGDGGFALNVLTRSNTINHTPVSYHPNLSPSPIKKGKKKKKKYPDFVTSCERAYVKNSTFSIFQNNVLIHGLDFQYICAKRFAFQES